MRAALIPHDFALTHITVNSGDSQRLAVFLDQSLDGVARVCAAFAPLLRAGTSRLPAMDAIHASMLNIAPSEGVAWYLHPAGEPRRAMLTCFASLTPNPSLFAQAVEMARNQSYPAAGWLAAHQILATPEPPWLATVLHLPMADCPPEYLPMIADIDQCIAAVALHYQI